MEILEIAVVVLRPALCINFDICICLNKVNVTSSLVY